MYPVERSSARLGLRELTPDDVDAVHAIYGSAEATEHLSFEPRTRDQVKKIVARSIDAATATPRTEYALAVIKRDTAELIGFGRLATDPHQQRGATMGFALRPDVWGRGYGVETVRLLLSVGFDDLGLLDADERGLLRLALFLALLDRGGKAAIDLVAQQGAQGILVAGGESGDDHLVGGLGAGEEFGTVEAGIDRAQAGRDCVFGRGLFRFTPRQGHDIVTLAALIGFAFLAGTGEGRPAAALLMAGALAQNGTETQGDKTGNRAKQQNVEKLETAVAHRKKYLSPYRLEA